MSAGDFDQRWQSDSTVDEIQNPSTIDSNEQSLIISRLTAENKKLKCQLADLEDELDASVSFFQISNRSKFT
jgi:hypothetical protein